MNRNQRFERTCLARSISQAIKPGPVCLAIFSIGFVPAVSAIDVSELNGNNGLSFTAVTQYDWTGASVSGAGDVNGDGIDDIIIGAPLVSPPNALNSGAAYIVFGRPNFASTGGTFSLSELNGSNGFKINAAEKGERLGSSVAAAGDINGDGFDDVIIGAPFSNPNLKNWAGRAYVVFGTGTSPPALELDVLGDSGFVLNGGDYEEFLGTAVSGVGDIDADGFDDVIVGGHGVSPDGKTSAGAAYVVFGKATQPRTIETASLGNAGITLKGHNAWSFFGRSASGVGDVNGDGFDDFIIGALQETPANGKYAGSSYLVYGGDNLESTIELGALRNSGMTMNGTVAFDFLGRSVSGAGDVNSDGFDDIIVSANGTDANGKDYSGSSYVVFGGADIGTSIRLGVQAQTCEITINGATENDSSGISVSGVGDVNNDGFADFAIGAWSSPGGIRNAGSAYVIFGGALPAATVELADLDSVSGIVINGIIEDSFFGNSVSGAGDFNGDGIDDIIVGGMLTDTAYVLFGSR